MNILIVTTGGTICSTASAENGNKNNVNTGAVLPVLVDEAKNSLKECMDVSNLSFDIVSPINVLSENMTIEDWNVLIAELKKVDYEAYSGLILLHGTDSLHMTAPLLSVLMKGLKCPVILVSGNRIITDPESNAVDNFANAVKMIRVISEKKRPKGIYVVYRNMDKVSYVHQAAYLEECADYSEDFFSRDMIRTEDWLGSELSAKESFEDTPEDISLIEYISELKDDVLYIKPYVGINYDRFSLEGVRCVLHSLYHSSTANAADTSVHSALHMLKRCKAAGIPMYIYPCNKESYRYVTTKALLEEGAVPLDGGTWNLAFAKLLIDGAMQGEEKIKS